MKQFGLQPLLLAGEGMGAGAGAGLGTPGDEDQLSQRINAELNKAFAAWAKKDLPKLIQQNMQSSFEQFAPRLSEQVLSNLVEQLPSDEEIDQMEAEAAGGAQDGQGGMDHDGQGNGNGDFQLPPEVNARFLQMDKANRQMQQQIEVFQQEAREAQEQAELADRVAQIQGALNKYPFTSDVTRQVAFDYFLNRVDRAEDGSLVAEVNGTSLPLDSYVDQNMGEMAGLLNAKMVGGSGASNGYHQGARAPVPSMEQIRPDMKPEDRKAIMDHSVRLLQEAVAPPQMAGLR